MQWTRSHCYCATVLAVAAGGPDAAANGSRDQANKQQPSPPGDQADAGGSGKSTCCLMATSDNTLQAANTHTASGNNTSSGNLCNPATGNGATASGSSSDSHSAAAAAPDAASGTPTTHQGAGGEACTVAAAAAGTHVAAPAAGDNSSSTNTGDAQPQPQLNQGQHSAAPAEVFGKTLSNVWSSILASKALQEARTSSSDKGQTAGVAASSSNTLAAAAAAGATDGATSPSRGSSSEDSLLTASDAVVHLMPTGSCRLIGEL